ncbi:MAG: exodeoxyribonuclease VII small subunit [Candidatus Zixiibacteriota bacterium]
MVESEVKNKESFEETLQKLEKSVASLESGEVPLEEALKLFEEGIRLSRDLASKLSDAEKKVKKLTESGSGGFSLEDLDGEEDGD